MTAITTSLPSGKFSCPDDVFKKNELKNDGNIPQTQTFDLHDMAKHDPKLVAAIDEFALAWQKNHDHPFLMNRGGAGSFMDSPLVQKGKIRVGTVRNNLRSI